MPNKIFPFDNCTDNVLATNLVFHKNLDMSYRNFSFPSSLTSASGHTSPPPAPPPTAISTSTKNSDSNNDTFFASKTKPGTEYTNKTLGSFGVEKKHEEEKKLGSNLIGAL